MALQPLPGSPISHEAELQRAADLLGGSRILRHRLDSSLDAHEMLLQGIPGAALVHLVGHLAVLQKSASFERAVGMSLRTIQRRKDASMKPLNQEQSGRTWKFAEILAKATAVLGSQDQAEEWLQQPAMGLDQRRPIDLLATQAGAEIVQEFLGRLEYGVYT
jgi:putative toxin-antitoxin system antitoxin component (TIGR02293 family)